jgi:hypothetical protein
MACTETGNEHEQEDYKIDINEDEETSYQCKMCELSYKTKQGVRQHISKKHKKKQNELDKSLDLDVIEREVSSESAGPDGEVFKPGGMSPNVEGFVFQPPNSQADFDLNVTKLFQEHEKENTPLKKSAESSPPLSTPKTISWRTKCEEKENELTLALVKIANLEQTLRVKEDDLSGKNDDIERFVKTESELNEQIRMLTSQLKEKDDLLQTACAQVESSDLFTSSKDDKMKEKDSKIARYGTYITQLVAEVKSLKSKQKENTTTGADPANDVIVKLSKENKDLHTKVKKVSEEVKSGKAALRKVEDNNSVLAKSIRDLQDKLNCVKNNSSKIEVEKRKLERNTDRLEDIIEITSERQNTKKRDTGPKSVEEKCRFYEANGWCRFGKECHNLHPTLYCEWFLKVGKCPIDNCKDLHSKKDCPFWSRGFCKNDPKLRGSTKRERSICLNNSPAYKRIKIVPSEDKKN